MKCRRCHKEDFEHKFPPTPPKPKTAQRPQGEWIKVKEERMSIDMSGEIVTRYKCSKCGRTITILPSKLTDYPFCHCGAEMRKPNCVRCDHFGDCDGCEKGEEE
jgi:hypothetical protein